MLTKHFTRFLMLATLTFYSHSALARFQSNQSALPKDLKLPHPILPNPAGMQFKIHPRIDQLGVLHILGRGAMEIGDTKHLKSFIAEFPGVSNIILHLSSGGGSLDAGLNLGRYVFDRRIKTAIDPHDNCLSACSLVFYAGRDQRGKPWRASSKNSGLGIHAIRYENSHGTVLNIADGLVQQDISRILKYAEEVDIPISVIRKKLQTNWQDMYLLSETEKCDSNVRIWDGHERGFSKCSPIRR